MKESDQEIGFRVGVELPVGMQPAGYLGISVLLQRGISAWTTTWKGRGCRLPYMDARIGDRVTSRLILFYLDSSSRLASLPQLAPPNSTSEGHTSYILGY